MGFKLNNHAIRENN
uniref:Uncharacterized protein n=1 Tax=Arundo donax TaxID=35708 RepID=A0A0A9BMA4_ARUDO